MATPEERDLAALVYNAVRAVDGVFRDLAGDVARLVTNLPTDRRVLMRAIDRLLDRAFGITQKAALVSELFNVIAIHTNTAAARPFQRAIERVRKVIDRRDASWWSRVRAQSSFKPNDGFLRVVDLFDTFDAFGNRVTPRALAERRARLARSLDPQRRWVDPDGYRLSDRVWKQGRWVRRQIDDTLRDGIRNGESAVDIAKRLERFLNPDKAPTRYTRGGKVVTRNITRKPKGAPYGSSYARTLARTEITRVYGAATIESAKVTPGCQGIRWRLSSGHTDIDECDRNAHRSSDGMGQGEYVIAELPRYPSHPNETCTLIPVMASREDVLDEIVRRYGL